MPRSIAQLLLGVLLGACSPDPAPEPGRVERLALAWADGPVEAAPARLVRQLVPGVGGPWRLQGPGTAQEEVDGRSCVRFDESGERVQVQVKVEPGSFNQIVVRCDLEGPHSLLLEVSAGEARLARSLELDGRDQQALFDLGELRRWAEPVDGVALAVRGPGCRVHSLELLALPLEATLPALEAPRQVDLSGQARDAVGLPSGRALEAEFVVSAGQRLELACGQPEFALRAGQTVTLRVTLDAGDARSEHQLPLEPSLSESSRWHALSIPLDELAGRRVRARFELEGSEDAAVPAVLSWPLLVTPGS